MVCPMRWQTLAKEVGKRMREIRGEKGLTQEKAAELSKSLSLRHWQYLEQGTKNCTLHSLTCIAKALNVPIKDLIP